MANDAKFNGLFLNVSDWKDKVYKQDLADYSDLDDLVQSLYAKVQNEDRLSQDQLKVIARTLQRAITEQKKIIYKYDFQLFIDEVFADMQDKAPTPWFHLEMYNAFQQAKRVCVVCPRGHGKSTSACLYILHQILNQQRKYVVLIGSSEDMAGQNLRWIRDQLIENEILLEIYGNIQNKRKWAETEFATTTGIKVTAKGAGQKIRGMREKGRPDLIYIDDLEDDEMVRNKDTRNKNALWLKNAVLPAKSKNGDFIFSGTVLHNDSLLKNVALNKYRDHIKWRVLWYQALTQDKETGKYVALWPEMKPVSELLEIKKADPQTFAQEYQNNPVSGEMAVFKREWFNYFDKKDIEVSNSTVSIKDKELNLMLHTDFAISEKEGSDYTVFTVSGMARDGSLYVLDMLRFRSSDIYDMIQELFKMIDKWYIDFLTMEKMILEKALNRQIEREQDLRRRYFHIESMARTKITKMARFKALQLPMRAGKVFFLPEFTVLEDEMLALTVTRLPPFDDCIDTLSDAWEMQNEFRKTNRREEPVVNTMAWAEKQGFIPLAAKTHGRRPIKRRR